MPDTSENKKRIPKQKGVAVQIQLFNMCRVEFLPYGS